MNTQEKYNELLGEFSEIQTLGTIRSVLNYDLETATMPPAALEFRGKQMSLIASMVHKRNNSENYKSLVNSLHNADDLDDIQKRNVELLYRNYQTATSVPKELVMKLAEQANKTNQSWKKAKAVSDWKIVKEDVEKLFNLTVERAQILADVKGFKDPQSALLSERDYGFTVDVLDKIFSETREFLVPLLKKVTEKHKEHNLSDFNNKFSRDVKVKLAETIADFYEYDYNSPEAVGRIGNVEHPLTIRCGPKDTRITVNFTTNFSQVMSSTQHEIGHGLHSLNNGAAKEITPITSMGFPSVSEMTSRYTENKIGKDLAFWKHYLPIMQKITGLKTDLKTFYNGFTHVSPTNKRMKADEISYGLHIIIRFELEKMLFDQKLDFAEVPLVWADKYNEYLGVEVKTDTDGPLQDLHWYSYYWCYFQGYALGDLLGSQVHYHMQKQVPTWSEDMAKGKMSTINNYFKKQIYSLGARYDPLDLVKNVTGKPFETKYLKKYLEEKYLV